MKPTARSTRSGLGIIETLVALGISGIVILGVTSLMKQSGLSAKNVNQDLELSSIRSEALSLLGVTDHCTKSFENLVLVGTGAGTVAGHELSLVYKKADGTAVSPAMATKDKKIAHITIESVIMPDAPIPLSPVGTYKGDLKIIAKKDGQHGAVARREIVIPIKFTENNTTEHKVASCAADGSSDTAKQICMAMNGLWDEALNKCVFRDLQISNDLSEASSRTIISGLYSKGGARLGSRVPASFAEAPATLLQVAGLNAADGEMGMGANTGANFDMWYNGGSDGIFKFSNTKGAVANSRTEFESYDATTSTRTPVMQIWNNGRIRIGSGSAGAGGAGGGAAITTPPLETLELQGNLYVNGDYGATGRVMLGGPYSDFAYDGGDDWNFRVYYYRRPPSTCTSGALPCKQLTSFASCDYNSSYDSTQPFNAGSNFVCNPGSIKDDMVIDHGNHRVHIGYLTGGGGGATEMLSVNGGARIEGDLYIGGSLKNANGTIIPNNYPGPSLSDERAKKNKVPYRGSLDKVLQIGTFEFDWRPEAPVSREELKRRQVGVIAQDVERAEPKLVWPRSDGYKGVNSLGLVALAIGAIHEVWDRVVQHDTRIEKLEEQVKRQDEELALLKAEIERLKSSMRSPASEELKK